MKRSEVVVGQRVQDAGQLREPSAARGGTVVVKVVGTKAPRRVDKRDLNTAPPGMLAPGIQVVRVADIHLDAEHLFLREAAMTDRMAKVLWFCIGAILMLAVVWLIDVVWY